MNDNKITIKGDELTRVSSLLIGSIGTVVETSQLQLEAFNGAFKEFDLRWHWSREEYEGLLIKAGGEIRIRDYDKTMGTGLSNEDITAVYRMKGKLFAQLLEQSNLAPRKGLVSLLDQCSNLDIFLGWVTTTSVDNVQAIQKALKGQVDFGLFNMISDSRDCSESKPNPEIYFEIIKRYNLDTGTTVAIEDSFSGVSSAKGTGIYCIVTPGEFKRTQDYGSADFCLDDLEEMRIVG